MDPSRETFASWLRRQRPHEKPDRMVWTSNHPSSRDPWGDNFAQQARPNSTTLLRSGLDVPDEQLGFVDTQGPGSSTTPSTDLAPTAREQAEAEVSPQDQPTTENDSYSVQEPETERLTVTPDVSPHMSQFPMLTKINFEKNCSMIKDAGA